MSDMDSIRAALCGPLPNSRGERRAAKTRAQAFSPLRILLRLAAVPVVAFGMTITIYTATSPFEREDSLRHLVAMGGCDAAERVGLKHIAEGTPGYHSKFDPDGNGITCEDPMATYLEATAPQPEPEPQSVPLAEEPISAKFLRP